MTQPSNFDRNVKREIILRATAQLAWDLVNTLPVELDKMINDGVITADEICSYFQEELGKLI